MNGTEQEGTQETDEWNGTGWRREQNLPVVALISTNLFKRAVSAL
jgi:hypothetical protein